jgi:drug/metabolite transporter (DMT)-like permease
VEISLESVVAWLYLGIFGTLVAFTAYTWLLRSAPISKVVTHQYVNPVVAIALGALVLDEQLTLAIAAGAALIVGSVFVAVRSENAAARKLRSPGTADVRGTPADRTA